MIDFGTIADAALANAESLVASWLPEGRKQGREWVARNPTRADGKPGSFSVNLDTGKWADFATGDRGGDLVSLLAYLRGWSQKEAAEALAGELGLPGSRGGQSRRSRGATLATVREKPRNAKISKPTEDPKVRHPKRGEPSATWAYQNAEGVTVGFACRFDEGNGEKAVLPYSWTGTRWDWKAMPEPRPLYNLPELLNRPATVVVVCEGEKATDAAGELFPEAVATTWPGGCQAWKLADWEPLIGRRVILWPDADETGRDTMAELKSHLLESGAERVALPVFPEGLPKGWDAADALAEGWSRDEVLAVLAERFTSPLGLCPLCWRTRVAAPVGGPTCRHSGFKFPVTSTRTMPDTSIHGPDVSSEDARELGYAAYWDGHPEDPVPFVDPGATEAWRVGYRTGQAEAAAIDREAPELREWMCPQGDSGPHMSKASETE